MNGDQIVIRGIQAKNNVVLVNGIQLPSTDVNTRTVDLGFISSNMLSGIEVSKTLTRIWMQIPLAELLIYD